MTSRFAIWMTIAAILGAAGCDTTQPVDASGTTRTAVVTLDIFNPPTVDVWNLWVYGFDLNGDGTADDIDGDGSVDRLSVMCQSAGSTIATAVPTHFTAAIRLVEPGSTEATLVSPDNAQRNDLNNLTNFDLVEVPLDIANAPQHSTFPALVPIEGFQTTETSRAYFGVLGTNYQIPPPAPCPNVDDPGSAGIGLSSDPVGELIAFCATTNCRNAFATGVDPGDPDEADRLASFCDRSRCRSSFPFTADLETGATLVVEIQRSDLAIQGLDLATVPTLAAFVTVDGERVTTTGNIDTADATGTIKFFYKAE